MFKRFRRRQDKPSDSESVDMPIVSLDRDGSRWPHVVKVTLVILLTLIGLIAVAVLAAYLYITKLPLRGEPQGRVNILVMGVDEAASLSDTLMLVSFDTRSGQEPKVAMVSIPRDLWVEIPGFGSAKINSAYSIGEQTGYPGGGARLSAKTVETVFGQPVHYYFALDFAGFRRAIDAVGGVEVEVKEDIYDPFFPDGAGGYDPYSIEAGPHHLDGEAALKYTRSRFTTSDFDRADRQQQVLLAARDKLLASDVIADAGQRQQLREVYEQHIYTDMGLRELLKLGNLAREIPPDSYLRHVLSNRPESFLVDAYFAGYVLVPASGTFEQISQMIAEIFDNPPPALDAPAGD